MPSLKAPETPPALVGDLLWHARRQQPDGQALLGDCGAPPSAGPDRTGGTAG